MHCMKSVRRQRRLMGLKHVVLLAGAALSLAHGCAFAQTAYTASVLGDLSSEGGSNAYGINNAGVVVGDSVSGGIDLPVTWSGANPSALSLSALGTAYSGANAAAQGINNTGLVVGSSTDPNTKNPVPVAWVNGNPMLLSTLGLSLGSSTDGANAVNDAGVIVGAVTDNHQVQQAVEWGAPGAVATVLPSLGGDSQANAINNAGMVVGSSNGQAVYWQGGIVTALTPPSPPFASTATGINSSGVIVGMQVDNSGRGYATEWSGGTVTVLPTIAGDAAAAAINDQGVVVGSNIYFDHVHHLAAHAVIWDNGTEIDLNQFFSSAQLADGWFAEAALAINNDGLIVAQGYTSHGSAIFEFAPVPEPSTVLLLMAGAPGLLVGHLRRRRSA